MRPALALALLALAAAGCGDPLLFAELETRRVCIARIGESIPGSPVGAPDVTWSGEVDLGDGITDLKNALSGDVRVLGVTVRNATADLSGVTELGVTLTDDAGATTDVLDYALPAGTTGPLATLAATGGDALNVFSYVDGGLLRFSIHFAGTPPTTQWTADVELCVSAKVQVDALEAAR